MCCALCGAICAMPGTDRSRSNRPTPPGISWPNKKVRAVCAVRYAVLSMPCLEPTGARVTGPRRLLAFHGPTKMCVLCMLCIMRCYVMPEMHNAVLACQKCIMSCFPPRTFCMRQVSVCMVAVEGREERTSSNSNSSSANPNVDNPSEVSTSGRSSSGGYSYMNDAEAREVMAVVQALLAPGGGVASAADIGVVTPYNGQVMMSWIDGCSESGPHVCVCGE